MTIIPMGRVTISGMRRDKAAALDGMQALGVLHVIPLAARNPLAPDDPAVRRRAETAFRHVIDAPEKLRPYRADAGFDAEAVIANIVANRLKLRDLADRRDELDALIEGLEPWGDFTLPRPEDIGGQRLWLYRLPTKDRTALDRLELPYEIVGRAGAALEVVVIAPDAPPVDLLPVARIDTGDAPLSDLRARREDLEIEHERAEAERAELTRWRFLLGTDLAAAQDRDDLRAVTQQTWDEAEVFALQGWAPVDAEAGVERFAADRGLAVMIDEPGPGDAPPTLLRPREERFAIGADLTNFYATPGYRSWDPSLIVFVSFAVFFAMIVVDAGYAALFGLATAIYWTRMGASAAGRRMRVLLAALSGVSFVYGVMAGSYFGMVPPPDSRLGALRVIDVNDFDTMMVVSIAVGMIHIGIALGVVAWLNRGTGRAIVALGWLAAMAAGLLVWLGGDAGRAAGFVLLAASLAAVFWGNASSRPIDKPTDWLLRLSDGLLGVTGVAKLFGDILSYLRLFALGLASASLGATFNQLAGEIHANVPGLGILLAVLILLVGHTINILIGIMGGVVQGLRLNYIEFFGWGVTEEGYPFRAFAKRESPA